MNDALTAARPTTLRLGDVTLTSGSSAPLGPLVVVVDRAGLTFWHPGHAHGRVLPWRRVRRVGVDGGDGGTAVLVATDRQVHRLWVPGADPGHTANRLAAAAGEVPVTFRQAGGPDVASTASPEATFPEVAGTGATAPRRTTTRARPATRITPRAPHPSPAAAPSTHPPAAAAPSTAPPEPPAAPSTSPSPAAAPPTPRAAHRAPAAVPAWFARVRPVLTVVLVLAVATMVALVLADSMGAIHLGWLGGGAGGQIPPGH